MFHVGQLVVCVDDSMARGASPFPGAHMARRGTIYTVRAIISFPIRDVFLFEELNNEHLVPEYFGAEPGFATERFRPLSDSRLAIFRQMLAPIPEHEPA
jgi:hypothetical protein